MPIHLPKIVPAALAILLLLPACDRDTDTDEQPPDEPAEPADESPDPTPPEFSWRTALDSPEEARTDALGEPTDCDPDAMPFTDVQGVLTAPDILEAMCRYPDADAPDDALYTVDGLLFSDGTPIAVRLTPADETELGPRLVGDWNLPELPAVRRLRIGDDTDQRPLLAYRADRLAPDTDPGTPFGLDFVAHPDTPDTPETLDYALVYATGADTTFAESLALEGPPAADDETILPATPPSQSPLGQNVLRIGLTTVELAPWDHYTVPSIGDADPTPSPVSFPREQMTDTPAPDDEGWESTVDRFVDALLDTRDADATSSTFVVAATQTAPVGAIDELLGTVASRTETKFQLLTRDVDRMDAGFHPYANATAYNVDFRPLADGMPDGATTQSPGVGDDLPRHSKGAYLNLQVKVGIDGFEVLAGGDPLPPRSDCPDPGPTVCRLDQDLPVDDTVERARQLHRDGDLEAAAETLDEALATYDWAGLHATLDRVAGEVPNSSHIFIEPQGGLPAALPLRTIALARHRLAAPDADDCTEEFSSNDDLLAAEPCTDEDGRPITMFDRPIWLAE